jgi:hypothetical protein
VIRLDLTTSTVTVEGDGVLEHFLTVRTMQRGSIPASVRRFVPDVLGLEANVRTRSGDRVFNEFDITESGVYELLSAHIDSAHERRHIELGVEFQGEDGLRLTVLPNSSACAWVVEDTLQHFVTGDTMKFDLLITLSTVGEGCIHLESEKEGVKKHRATAWERILADDPDDDPV